MTRLLAAVRRRPYRVVEFVTAVLGLLAAFGLELQPEQSAAVLAVVAFVVSAGEAAQTQTTSLADPHDRDGRPLTPAAGVD